MNTMLYQYSKALGAPEVIAASCEAEMNLCRDLENVDGCNVTLPLALNPKALAGAVGASFRASSHINNVMTHISGARWDRIEIALSTILDLTATPVCFSPLETNIVELICAERGVTGRLVKPYFQSQLERLLPRKCAARLSTHVSSLHAAS